MAGVFESTQLRLTSQFTMLHGVLPMFGRHINSIVRNHTRFPCSTTANNCRSRFAFVLTKPHVALPVIDVSLRSQCHLNFDCSIVNHVRYLGFFE